MIPLVPAATSAGNPGFCDMWEHVTKNMLEGDGSRRDDKGRQRGWIGGPKGESGGDEEADDKDPTCQTKLNLEAQLDAVRVGRMKREILRQVLGEVAYRPDADRPSHGRGMPNDLRDLLLVVSAYLEVAGSSTDPDPVGWLADDVRQFKGDVNVIARAVGGRMDAIRGQLWDVAKVGEDEDGHEDAIKDGPASIESRQKKPPSLPPSSPWFAKHPFQNRPRSTTQLQPQPQSQPPSTSPTRPLLDTLTRQVDHLSTLRSVTLPSRLVELQTTLDDHLSQGRHLLARQVKTLESAKHGVASRHLLGRTAFLAAVAEAMALKTKVLVLEARAVQNEDGKANLVKQKLARLQTEGRKLDDTLRQLQTVVGEYERAGVEVDHPNSNRKSTDDQSSKSVRVMTTLGHRYAQIDDDIDAVRADIRRLERPAPNQ